MPALSQANGVVGVQAAAVGEASEHAGGLLFGGQWTMPVAERFGARASLNAGVGFDSGASPREAVSGSLGAFWRRPEKGFLEISGSAVHIGNADRYIGGLTGGFFLDAWDVEAGGGLIGGGGDVEGVGRVGVGRCARRFARTGSCGVIYGTCGTASLRS